MWCVAQVVVMGGSTTSDTTANTSTDSNATALTSLTSAASVSSTTAADDSLDGDAPPTAAPPRPPPPATAPPTTAPPATAPPVYHRRNSTDVLGKHTAFFKHKKTVRRNDLQTLTTYYSQESRIPYQTINISTFGRAKFRFFAQFLMLGG